MSRVPLSRETIGLGLGFVGMTVFGGTLPFTRLAVEGLSPGFVTAGRAALAGILALVVYRWIGVEILRRAWINLDLIWTGALALAGVITITLGAWSLIV